MKNYVLVILVCVCVMIQAAIFPFLKIFNVHPDLVMTVILTLSILLGAKKGMPLGLLAGVLLDFIMGGPIGIYIVIYGVIGLVAGLMETKVFKDNYLLPLILAFAITVLKGLLEYILLKYSGVSVSIVNSFSAIVLPEALYNAIIAPVVYYWIYRLPFFKYLRIYPYGIM